MCVDTEKLISDPESILDTHLDDGPLPSSPCPSQFEVCCPYNQGSAEKNWANNCDFWKISVCQFVIFSMNKKRIYFGSILNLKLFKNQNEENSLQNKLLSTLRSGAFDSTNDDLVSVWRKR